MKYLKLFLFKAIAKGPSKYIIVIDISVVPEIALFFIQYMISGALANSKIHQILKKQIRKEKAMLDSFFHIPHLQYIF